MYTIFKNDCVFNLTDQPGFSGRSDFFQWKKFDLHKNLAKCNPGVEKLFYLYHADLNDLWEQFRKEFTVIDAAGGVVQNSENELLFIYRFEKWDLPKGKVEKNENYAEAALREVKEECGITEELVLGEPLGSTYHIYEHKGKEILKRTHWFKMFTSQKTLKPQLEEDITRAVWKGKEDVDSALENTYANIRLLFDRFVRED